MKVFTIKSIALLFLLTASFRDGFGILYWNQASDLIGDSTCYLSVPHSSSLNITGSFTIEAWICPLNALIQLPETIVEKRAFAGTNGFSLSLNATFNVILSTNQTVRLTSKSAVSVLEWTHVAGAYDSAAGIYRIFINGVQDTSAVAALTDPGPAGDSLRIGKSGTPGSPYPFLGYIDEVRVWKRNLGSIEISSNYRTSLGASTGVYNGLVLSLTFQDKDASGSFYSLFDWSGNGNDADNSNVSAKDLSSRPSNTVSLNESADLDGNGYLSGQDNPDISPGSGVTMESWVYPRSISGTGYVIHKGNEYELKLINGILVSVINGVTFTSIDTIKPGLWTHIAFAFEDAANHYTFYVNGDKTVDGTISASLSNGSDSLNIGGSSSGNNFDGFIDEVRISGYAKSQSVITGFMFCSIDKSNEPNSPLKNVVYNFDGYTYDNSDNGPQLRFVNSARFSHPSATNNKPVSPVDRMDNLSFQSGFYLSNTSRRVPAAGSTGSVSDTIKILKNNLISDIEVFVAVNHTAEEELRISLKGPNGDSVILFDSDTLRGNSDNVITIFDDNADSSVTNSVRYVSISPAIRPRNSFTVFSGENVQGLWTLTVNDKSGAGTGRLNGWGIRFNGGDTISASLSLNVLIEGFYDYVNYLSIPDTLDIFCRSSAPPYTGEVGIMTKTPDDGGYSFYEFNSISIDDSFYISVEHRNTIETWSKTALRFDYFSRMLEYDFTSAIGKAYGNNMKQIVITPPEFALFGGDVNRDDAVDLSDITAVFNDANNFVSGYVNTDVTGDNQVDLSDLVLTFNNSRNFVVSVTPVNYRLINSH